MARNTKLFRCWATWAPEGWSYFSSPRVAGVKAQMGYAVQEWDEASESWVPWN